MSVSSGEYKPVEHWLGKETFQSLQAIERVQAMIIEKSKDRMRVPLNRRLILLENRLLNDEQVEELKSMIMDSTSYYNGWPIYRRFPPNPGFVFAIETSYTKVDLLVDLQNLGWEF